MSISRTSNAYKEVIYCVLNRGVTSSFIVKIKSVVLNFSNEDIQNVTEI